MSFVNIMSGENQMDSMSRMHGNQTIMNNMALLAAAEAGGGNTTLSNNDMDKFQWPLASALFNINFSVFVQSKSQKN